MLLWRKCRSCHKRIWGGIMWGYHQREHFNEAVIVILQSIIKSHEGMWERLKR